MSDAWKDLRQSARGGESPSADDKQRVSLEELRAILREGICQRDIRNLREGMVEELPFDMGLLDHLEDDKTFAGVDPMAMARKRTGTIGRGKFILSPGANPAMTMIEFGKFKGKCLGEIHAEEPGYLVWLKNEGTVDKGLRELARQALSELRGKDKKAVMDAVRLFRAKLDEKIFSPLVEKSKRAVISTRMSAEDLGRTTKARARHEPDEWSELDAFERP